MDINPQEAARLLEGAAERNSDQLACPNISYGSGNGLSMDAKRADRFTDVMYRIERAVQSLESAASMFPAVVTGPGYMDASTTVKAFTGHIDADIRLLHQMIENEEAPEVVPDAEDHPI